MSEEYVLGSAAGRPFINAVGMPRVVINGMCLDYLAESLMAGDPYNGGGFVVVNGLKPSFDGRFVEHDTPTPGATCPLSPRAERFSSGLTREGFE